MHAYETTSEFFHKVFNKTVEIFSLARFFRQAKLDEASGFSSSWLRCNSEYAIFASEPEWHEGDALSSP